MTDRCTFCGIVAGETPARVVYEDDSVLAFLDRRPLFPGHCLLVPKDHHETLQDLPSELVAPLFAAARLVTQAVEQAMSADGSFVAINNRVSQSAPHLHIHIVPRRRRDGLRGFFWPRHPYDSEAHRDETQAAIRKAVAEAS